METAEIIAFLKDFAFLLVTFGVFFVYAMAKGRYAIINLIFGLYIALLITYVFPFWKYFPQDVGDGGGTAKIIMFIAILVVAVMLFRRHIPGDDFENALHNFWTKALLASMATILVMLFSIHILPVSDIINPGTPIEAIFAPEEYFFWWLILPLVALFFV